MSSNSLTRWTGERSEAIAEIENAHVMVGGSDRGRRFATQQINYSYTTILSAQFQGFCRDLHTECVDQILTLVPSHLHLFLRNEFIWNRSLSRGNPHPGAIGADFNRLGVDFWNDVLALDSRNHRRRVMLQELIDWRNAIAHHDFDRVASDGNTSLQLVKVRGWLSAVNNLAYQFDRTMYHYLHTLLGRAPW